MGMCLALCTLSDENLRKVLADPPLIWKVIAPDDPEVYENSRKGNPAGFFAKLFGRRKKDEPIHPSLTSQTARSSIPISTRLGTASTISLPALRREANIRTTFL